MNASRDEPGRERSGERGTERGSAPENASEPAGVLGATRGRVNFRLLAGLFVAALVVAGLAFGTGAVGVDNILSDDRDAIEDTDVFLAPADTPEGDAYAEIVETGDGQELTVDIDDLNPRSTTAIDDVFVLGNEYNESREFQRTALVTIEPVDLSDDAEVTFRDMATGEEIATDNRLELLPGETTTVGLTVEAGTSTDILSEIELDVELFPEELAIAAQATASSTIAGPEPTDAGVVVEEVRSGTDSAVVVTYEDGADTIVAGLETFDAGELDGTDVPVAIDDDGGFPGAHTAHLIPEESLSESYEPGDVLSADTAGAALDTASTTVFQGTVEFDDQSLEEAERGTLPYYARFGDDPVVIEVDGLLEAISDWRAGVIDVDRLLDVIDAWRTGEEFPLGENVLVSQADLLDGLDDDTLFQVDLRATDENGDPAEFVGASEVLSGQNEDVVVVPQDEDGEDIDIPAGEEYVATIHVVDEDAVSGDVSEGDEFPPNTFPALANADATDGFVTGGVADDAEILEPDE